MIKPVINFHNEYFKECFERYKEYITKSINDAWDKLIIPLDISFIKIIDIVTRGPRPQITFLVTRNGVIIRLDLGEQTHFEEDIHYIIYHEIFHLADRLDSKFEMNYHLDAESKLEKDRIVINILWDLYIDKRLFFEYKIKPKYCNDKKEQNITKINNKYRDRFLKIINCHGYDTNIFESIFNKVWCKSKQMTYMEIFHESMQFYPRK